MTVAGADSELAVSCKPNISAAGRRRRNRWGAVGAALSAVGLGASVVLGAPWYARAALFFPITLSALGLLQARRHTCVARAREGTFERDDLSTTPAAESEAAASRIVARGIMRDAVLIGVLGGGAAAGTAYFR